MTEKDEQAREPGVAPAGWHLPEGTPPLIHVGDEEYTFLTVPYVSDSANWRVVELEVLFGVDGKPTLVDVNAENLIEVEREELLAWLRR